MRFLESLDEQRGTERDGRTERERERARGKDTDTEIQMQRDRETRSMDCGFRKNVIIFEIKQNGDVVWARARQQR